MNDKLCIKNGKVVLKNKVTETDILVSNGKIADIGKLDTSDCEIINAEGNYVMPGFIDIHTHIDDSIGKYYLADTYTSSSDIALQNGITTLFTFITQKEGRTLIQETELAFAKLHYQKDYALKQNKTLCNIGYHLTPTTFDDKSFEEIFMLIEAGFKTFKFYTTYEQSGLYTSYSGLKKNFEKFKDLDCTILIHCEDNEIIKKRFVKYHRSTEPFIHTLLRPESAEIVAISKILDLASKYNFHIHIVHVSTAKGAELVYEYKKNYSNVTMETCPQYLFLEDSMLKEENGYRWLCSPPLRSEENMMKMQEYARKNFFDVYATDHCAFFKKDKDEKVNSIIDVPNGIAGIGALPHIIFSLYDNIIDKNILDISKSLSLNPAKITGLYPDKGIIKKGSDADILILKTINSNQKINSTLCDCYDSYSEFNKKYEVKNIILNGKIIT